MSKHLDVTMHDLPFLTSLYIYSKHPPFSFTLLFTIFFLSHISACLVLHSLSIPILNFWPIFIIGSQKINSSFVMPLLFLSWPWLAFPLIFLALWLEMHVAEWITPFSLFALLFDWLLSFCSSWLIGSLNSSPCQVSMMLWLNQRGMWEVYVWFAKG